MPELKSLLQRVLDSTATINKLATTTEGRVFAMKLRADYLRLNMPCVSPLFRS